MNSKRRAELQRKLSMGEVPKPPAGLAERIKADIPKHLQPVPEPETRFSWATTLRVAASLMLLITTAVVTMRIMEPEAKQATSMMRRERIIRVPQIATRTGTAADASSAPPAETEVELTIDEPLPLPRIYPAQQAQVREDDADGGAGSVREVRAEASSAGNDSQAFAYDVSAAKAAAPAPAAPPPPAPLLAATEYSPAPEPVPAVETGATSGRITSTMARNAAAAPAGAPVPPPPPASRDAETRYAPQIVAEAHAADLRLEAKDSVFGISVDPSVFRSIKTAIENGTRPAPQSVNVDAVVNYFAGPPARAPRRGVGLEVEASPAAVEAEGDRAILRFTVDTPRIEVPGRGSVPPAAQDARVTIDIDSRAVASIRRLGGSNAITAESTLLNNTSVTGLYELELKPRLRKSQRVATVRLTYRSVTDGRQRTIERVIHGHDLAKSWSSASRRHRLASLGALWSQTLTGSTTAPEVAKRAQELATQNPADTRARELANATRATGGGG